MLPFLLKNKKQMKKEIIRILNKERNPVGKDLKTLLDYYEKKAERIICRNCSGDINRAITELKIMTKSTNYILSKDRAIYKMRKSSKNTISNKNITDSLAEAFLTINPDRIILFSKYDEDFYNKLVGNYIHKEETHLEEEETDEGGLKVVKKDEPVKDSLEGKSLKELRQLYPNIKAVSTKIFIEKVKEQEDESNK